MPEHKSTPIIILGMHRSGTSCLAGSFQQTGVFLGDVSKQNKYNKKGNREHNEIMKLNESILAYNNASWHEPPIKEVQWTKKHEDSANLITSDLQFHSKSLYWAFKDPRTLLTLPFWESVLKDPKLVGTIRNPIAVAQSLNKRDENFSLIKGMELWLSYNTILLELLKKTPFPLISFDLAGELYSQKQKEIISAITPELSTSVDFYDHSLLTSTAKKEQIVIPNKIQQCFDELQEYLT